MSGQVFKLSELPRDIVVYLCQEHLAPAPAIALSLTCRDLFELLSRNIEYLLPLDKPDKAELCELLEKDISHNYYFCAICPSLHPFSVLQGPSCGDTVSALPQHDCRRWRWALKGSYFTLGLHHVRLAVNRHLFGRSSGIPLELFALRNLSWTHPSWLEDWSARIIDGDLFLASTRTFRWYSATDELCTFLHRQVYHLCEHVGLKDVQTLRPRGNIGIAMEYFLDIFGLCRECFMDYTFTAEPATGQVGGLSFSYPYSVT